MPNDVRFTTAAALEWYLACARSCCGVARTYLSGAFEVRAGPDQADRIPTKRRRLDRAEANPPRGCG
jgi:hypothetical protein